MNHTYSLHAEVATNTHLVDQVFGIIDSRIQYLEFQNNCFVDQCFQVETTTSSPSTSDDATPRHYLLRQFDQLMDYARQASSTLRLLYLLRSLLLPKNATLVLELLSNNRYLDYSEERLQFLLR